MDQQIRVEMERLKFLKEGQLKGELPELACQTVGVSRGNELKVHMSLSGMPEGIPRIAYTPETHQLYLLRMAIAGLSATSALFTSDSWGISGEANRKRLEESEYKGSMGRAFESGDGPLYGIQEQLMVMLVNLKSDNEFEWLQMSLPYETVGQTGTWGEAQIYEGVLGHIKEHIEGSFAIESLSNWVLRDEPSSLHDEDWRLSADVAVFNELAQEGALIQLGFQDKETATKYHDEMGGSFFDLSDQGQ